MASPTQLLLTFLPNTELTAAAVELRKALTLHAPDFGDNLVAVQVVTPTLREGRPFSEAAPFVLDFLSQQGNPCTRTIIMGNVRVNGARISQNALYKCLSRFIDMGLVKVANTRTSHSDPNAKFQITAEGRRRAQAAHELGPQAIMGLTENRMEVLSRLLNQPEPQPAVQIANALRSPERNYQEAVRKLLERCREEGLVTAHSRTIINHGVRTTNYWQLTDRSRALVEFLLQPYALDDD